MILSTPIPILGKQFMRSIDKMNSSTYIVDALPEGQQTSGLLGQVQCKDSKEVMSLNECSMAPDICNCESSIYTVSCDCKNINPSSFATSDTRLLIYSSDMLIKNNKATVEMEYPGSLITTVEVFGKLELAIVETNKDEDCKFKAKKILGCYSCLRGAEFKYTCRSARTITSIAMCGPHNISIICSDSDLTKTAHFLSNIPYETLSCLASCDKDSFPSLIQSSLDFHGFIQHSNSSRIVMSSSNISSDLNLMSILKNWGTNDWKSPDCTYCFAISTDCLTSIN